MSRPGSLTWFAGHELRLAWRDWFSMMTAGRKSRRRSVFVWVGLFVLFLHWIAFAFVGPFAHVAPNPGKPALIVVTASLLLSFSMMLSQAMESVTRAFYSRSDLDLILVSPARADRLFAVRIGAIALLAVGMSALVMGPFINMLALAGGVRWLAAYGVIVSLALTATAFSVALTYALFRLIGAKRTRLAAQIVAAILGATFVIGLQVAAILSSGTASRFAFLQSHAVTALAPETASLLWWPARAALGDESTLVAVFATSLALFVAAAFYFSPRFADCAILAAGTAQDRARHAARAPAAFQVSTPARTLRRKEWLLLQRDPWLMSQSLMQLLYLVPAALLLWRNFALGTSASLVLVPTLIMAAGQLAGGLAWLTISGEDAPDFIASAPVTARRILRAKIEAVLGAIAFVFAPLLLVFAFVSLKDTFVVAIGIVAAAVSATAIQLWFRTQAKRTQFRRRHTSSRIATFAEAFSSITWAAAGGLAAAGSLLAPLVGLLALALLGGTRWLSPAQT